MCVYIVCTACREVAVPFVISIFKQVNGIIALFIDNMYCVVHAQYIIVLYIVCSW